MNSSKFPTFSVPIYDRLDFWASLADDSTDSHEGSFAHQALALRIVTMLAIDYLPGWMMRAKHEEFISMVDDVADVIAATLPSLDVSQFAYLHDGKPSVADYEAASPVAPVAPKQGQLTATEIDILEYIEKTHGIDDLYTAVAETFEANHGTQGGAE